MPRVGVEKGEIVVGGISLFPQVPVHAHVTKQVAPLDVGPVVADLLRAWRRGVRLTDCVIGVLDLDRRRSRRRRARRGAW